MIPVKLNAHRCDGVVVGPYSQGKAARRILFGLIPIQQFGLAEIQDDGKVIEVLLSGRNERGELLDNMTLRMRCDDRRCEVVR